MEIDTWSFNKFSVNHLEWGKILVSGVEGGVASYAGMALILTSQPRTYSELTEWQKALASRDGGGVANSPDDIKGLPTVCTQNLALFIQF